MIALIDYGAGNVRSVYKALQTVGAQVHIVTDGQGARSADKVVLPGVGAFADCMAALKARGLSQAIGQAIGAGKPFLGICVGMQVLFDVGEEMGLHPGLGVLPGRVVRFGMTELKIPHTGWNQLLPTRDSALLAGLPLGPWVYFNHAYHCLAETDHVLGVTDYGTHFVSVVGCDNVYGIQFHPEKSQSVGLHILRNFVEEVE